MSVIDLDRPRMPARQVDGQAQARLDNARRLMAAALECFNDGHADAGVALRGLSRMEYARAAALMIGTRS